MKKRLLKYSFNFILRLKWTTRHCEFVLKKIDVSDFHDGAYSHGIKEINTGALAYTLDQLTLLFSRWYFLLRSSQKSAMRNWCCKSVCLLSVLCHEFFCSLLLNYNLVDKS